MNFVPSLFRYARLDGVRDFDRDKLGRFTSLVLDRVLYVPRVSQFNDPWDCAPQVIVNPRTTSQDLALHMVRTVVTKNSLASDERIIERHGNTVSRMTAMFDEKGFDAILDDTTSDLKLSLQTLLVSCFSSDSVTPLLWSYYAGGHSGYVVEFDSSVRPIGLAQKVAYDEDYPSVDLFRLRAKEVAADAIFSKGDFWRHEREWRLIVPEPGSDAGREIEYVSCPDAITSPGVFIRLPEGSIKSITLGMLMSRADREQAIDLVRGARSGGKGITLYRTKVQSREFRVERLEITDDESS